MINETIIILKIIILPRLFIFSYLHFQNLQHWCGVNFRSSSRLFYAKIQPGLHSILIACLLIALCDIKAPSHLNNASISVVLFVLLDCSRFIKPLGAVNQIEQCFQAKLISSGRRLFLNHRIQYVLWEEREREREFS